LEAGCGVGAQTVILAGSSPQAAFTSIDISEESLAAAQRRVQEAGFTNVTFQHADIFDLSFLSAHFHPDSDHARRAIQCLVDLQRQAGGDSLIGRKLYPLLVQAGYRAYDVATVVTLASFRRVVVGRRSGASESAQVRSSRSYGQTAQRVLESAFLRPPHGCRHLSRRTSRDDHTAYACRRGRDSPSIPKKAAGNMERRSYSQNPEHYEYLLTDKGRELVPVLLALTEWGDRWAAPDGPPVIYTHTACGDGISQQTICATCGQVHDPAEVRARPGPGMPADAAARTG